MASTSGATTDVVSEMNNVTAVTIANVTGIVILAILLYVSHARSLLDRLEDRLFSGLVVGAMLGCAMEMFTWFLDGKTFPGALTLNYIANTYIFTFNALLPLLLLVYVDLCLYGDIKRIWIHYKVQIFTGIGAVLVTVVNLFTGIVYYFDDANKYQRGPLNLLYYGVSTFQIGSVDAFMRDMDDRMYAMKEEHHKAEENG